MKKLIPFLVLLVGVTGVFAQGTVQFNNAVAFTTAADRRVYNVNGTPIVGSDIAAPANFVAQLYYGANATSLTPHTATPARFRPPGAGNEGLWLGGTRTLTGFAPGSTVTLQVRAWDSAGGSLNFDNALTRGSSTTFTYMIPQPGAPANAFFIENFRSFSLVPEPSVIGLGLLGAGALFLLRRRK